AVVVEPPGEPRVGRVERVQHLLEVARLERHLGLAGSELTQLGGNTNGHRHRVSSWPCGRPAWRRSLATPDPASGACRLLRCRRDPARPGDRGCFGVEASLTTGDPPD